MSDEVTQPDAGTAADEPSTSEPEVKTFSEEYVKKLRDEAASYRVKLKEIEDSEKTELQRAVERAEAAERALAEKQVEALRLNIAAKHGITGESLELLYGADEAELEARAQRIVQLITPKDEKKGAIGPYVPPEGSAPKGSVAGSTAQAFADAVEGIL